MHEEPMSNPSADESADAEIARRAADGPTAQQLRLAKVRNALKEIHAANPKAESGALTLGLHPADWVTAGALYKRRELKMALAALKRVKIPYRCRRHGRSTYVETHQRDRELATRILREAAGLAQKIADAENASRRSWARTLGDYIDRNRLLTESFERFWDVVAHPRSLPETFKRSYARQGCACGAVFGAAVGVVATLFETSVSRAVLAAVLAMLFGGLGFVVGLTRRRTR